MSSRDCGARRAMTPLWLVPGREAGTGTRAVTARRNIAWAANTPW